MVIIMPTQPVAVVVPEGKQLVGTQLSRDADLLSSLCFYPDVPNGDEDFFFLI